MKSFNEIYEELYKESYEELEKSRKGRIIRIIAILFITII